MGLKYIVGLALSLIVSLMLYPILIKYLKTLQLNQEVSEYALSEFKNKSKTPTMGGIIFLFIPVLTLFLINFSSIFDYEVLLLVAIFIIFGLIGFYDDYLILVEKSNIGFTTGKKFLLEIFVSFLFALGIYFISGKDTSVTIPFFKTSINLGYFYLILVVFMISGVSNSVNITDGMDGLAGGLVIIALIPYLYQAIKLEKIGIAILIFALLGSLFAYLFYNLKPARIFMGDVGSLSLGAFLAGISIILKMELSLIIIGGVFMLNTLSVIIQVMSVKLFNKRVFPYTPLHYSFIIYKVSERKVVYLFWSIGLIFMLLGLLS